jgi:hypothetical protein
MRNWYKLMLPVGNSFCKSSESSSWPVQEAMVTKYKFLSISYWIPERKLCCLDSISSDSPSVSTLYLHHSRDRD